MQRLAVIDADLESAITNYHVGLEPESQPDRPVTREEVSAEVQFDCWNALMQGVA